LASIGWRDDGRMHLAHRILVAMAVMAGLAGSDLESRLDEVLIHVPAGAGVGVAVIDTADHHWLYRHAAADQPLSLASTTKLVVATAALFQLGLDYQFSTRLVALGALKQGVLPGLGVIGGGSPCLDEHFATGGDPEHFFNDWVAELRRRGVTRIDGDLVIDNRLFSGPIRPATYPQDADNQQKWFSAPASAFAFNDNCIEVRLLPTSLGKPALCETRPRSPRIPVVNQSRSGVLARPIFSRDAQSNAITAAGTCGRTPSAWFPLAMHEDPDLLNGDQLKATLTDAGIPVSGSVRLGGVDPAAGELIADLRQDLVPAVTLMNQHSQNFYGEQLLRLVAVARGQDGSLEAGRSAVLAVLKERLGDGISDGITLLDGCGLSYGNQASATTMARLLDGVQGSPLREVLIASLKERPASGVRGRVKTGTLAIACCLVGYLEPPGKDRYAFAILLNKGEAASFDWAPHLRDVLYEAIAESLR
jgi:D-alanyl-D-alanine carboxypeptidase/D-alanyl-D-alanine-endopeptidase (penicillin-binding protein 4)